jgi:hypothetical protein
MPNPGRPIVVRTEWKGRGMAYPAKVRGIINAAHGQFYAELFGGPKDGAVFAYSGYDPSLTYCMSWCYAGEQLRE